MTGKKISLKPIIQIVVYTLFLIGGVVTGSLLETAKASIEETCYYEYCQDGNCYANQNATNCVSPNGQLPCDNSRPCFGC